MTRVVLDAAAEAQFRNLSDRAEVCDRNGHTLGLFLPATDHSLYHQIQVPFTEEELDRFEKEPGGRPLAEILEELGKLP